MLIRIYKGYTGFQSLHSQLFGLMDRIAGDDDASIILPIPPAPIIGMPLSSNPAYHQFGQELAGYLMALMCFTKSAKRFKLLMNFMGISRPFCDLKYQKVTEFTCKKQSQGRLNDGWLVRNVKSVFSRWQTRWVVLSSSSLFYYETPEDKGDTMRDSVTFDSDTQVVLGECTKNHLQLDFMLSRRTLMLEIPEALNGLINLHYIAKLFKKSAYAHTNRFKSFAPMRERNDCMFFPDGEGYFHEMRQAIEMARDDIMITDWWFSPEMSLERPIEENMDQDMYRIDRLLQGAAQRGVKVYVIVYKEFSMTMSNDSEHVKEALEKLSPNIKVLRHPNVVVSLWSHHEKMCVVDKKTVFMGGLDLCWGRFDYQEHPLFNDKDAKYFPGTDYYNPLKRDIVKSRNYKECMIDQSYPRMPWHDVAVMLRGQIARDFTSHFVTYWNHARETNSESEVLFSKKQGSGAFGEEKFHAKLVQAESTHGNENIESVDPYEANPGINLGVLQGIVQVNTNTSSNSVFEPQTAFFDHIQNQHVKQGNSFDKIFVDKLREENDKMMAMTAQKRVMTEAEKKIDEMIQQMNIPTVTTESSSDSLMPPILTFDQNNFPGHMMPPQGDISFPPPPLPMGFGNYQGGYSQGQQQNVPMDYSQPHFITGSMGNQEAATMNSLLLCGNNAEDNGQSIAPAQPRSPENMIFSEADRESKRGIFKAHFSKSFLPRPLELY